MKFGTNPGSDQGPNLATIAKAAGVSRMTVSLALRDQPGVNPVTRRRIRALADQLGYRLNPLVSAYQAHIRARRTRTYQANIAWVNDHPDPRFWETRPWLEGYLRGARARAELLGFKLETFHLPTLGDTPEKACARLRRVLLSRGVHGVVLPWLHTISHASADWSEFSVAMIGRNVGYGGNRMPDALPLFHHANPDIYYNTGLALRQLRAAGAQRIGLLVDKMNDSLAESLQRACFLVEQAEQPKSRRVPVFLQTSFALPEVRARFRTWFARWQPDALMLYDTSILEELPAAARRPGSRVKCVQLNLSPHEHHSGIDTRHDEISAACVNLVVSQLQHNERGRPAVPQEVLVKGEWRDVPTASAARASAAMSARAS